MRQPYAGPSDIASQRRLRGSRRHQVRIGLFAGGRWIPTIGTWHERAGFCCGRRITGINGAAKKGCFLGGTDGSNPSPSSGESRANPASCFNGVWHARAIVTSWLMIQRARLVWTQNWARSDLCGGRSVMGAPGRSEYGSRSRGARRGGDTAANSEYFRRPLASRTVSAILELSTLSLRNSCP
jgi:hypothetical protein